MRDFLEKTLESRLYTRIHRHSVQYIILYCEEREESDREDSDIMLLLELVKLLHHTEEVKI